MAGDSIYDVEYSQEQGMDSDVLNENDYTQDVFFITRPDEDAYFDKNYMDDEQVKYREKSLQRYNQDPRNWDNQQNYLVNPLNMDHRLGSAHRVVEAHLKEAATPRKKYNPNDANKPVNLQGRMPTLAKLMHYTSSFSKKRAPNTTVKIKKAMPEKNTWIYTARGREKWSDPAGHEVKVVLIPQEGQKDFREMKVQVTCDCKFWKYYGPDFNSGSGNRLDPYRLGPSKIDKRSPNGDPVNPAPNVRDPSRQNMICKHVAAVGKIFQKYAAKHNLDTYKQVEGIFDELEKQEKIDPDKEVNGIRAMVENMDRTQQKNMKPLLDKYDKEEDEYRKNRMRDDIKSNLEDNIESQDKNWLQKMLGFVKKFFTRDKSSSIKKASVERVLEMYLTEK